MVSSEVELLFPIDHAAPGASAELLGVFLVQLSSLGVQGSCGVDLVEHTSGVEKYLPDVVNIPLPLVEALWNIRQSVSMLIVVSPASH